MLLPQPHAHLSLASESTIFPPSPHTQTPRVHSGPPPVLELVKARCMILSGVFVCRVRKGNYGGVDRGMQGLERGLNTPHLLKAFPRSTSATAA